MDLKLVIFSVVAVALVFGTGESSGLACENSVADIVLLVDTSGSIATSQWNKQIQFIRTMVRNFTISPNNVQIGVVTFSNIVQTEFTLNRYARKQDVLTRINVIEERAGTTHTSKGLAFVRKNAFTVANGDRPNAPNILIVITDGRSTAGYEPKAEAELLKKDGVKIIAIGVGSGYDREELKDMATSERHMFGVTDFSALQTILSEVQAITCEVDGGWSGWDSWSDCSQQSCGIGIQYRERTCTNPSPSANGEPCQGDTREERPCFTPCPTTPAEVCVDSVADVVFLVDTSGSINHEEWRQQIQFIERMVEGFTIGPNGIQVGFATFSTGARNEFYLNRYNDKQGVLEGVDAVPERNGYTHTAAGLEFVRTNSFTAQNGDRPNVPDVLVVLTDGRATRSYDPAAEAALLKQAGVKIIAIGVGMRSGRSELESMASSQRQVFQVTDFSALEAILSEVQSATCQD